LNFDATRGPKLYIVSQKRDPEPELATALADYDAFVRALNEYVADVEDVLDGVTVDVPEPAAVTPVVEKRERTLGRIRSVCDRMAAELHRVDGTRWERSRSDRISYLRVGGEDGIYLLSQYEPPAVADLREHASRFREFVAAHNDHVAEPERDLARVEFRPGTAGQRSDRERLGWLRRASVNCQSLYRIHERGPGVGATRPLLFVHRTGCGRMGLLDFIRGLLGGGGDEGGSDGRRSEGREDGGDGGGDPQSSDDSEDAKDVREFGPSEFGREAEEFAEDHADREFDFTVESLERLDEYAASQTQVLEILDEEMNGGGELTGSVREGYILWFGSYFGEVIVRQFDGEWVTDGDGVRVAVPAGDGVAEVPPLDVAVVAVEEEPQFAATAAELRDRIERGAAGEGGPDSAEGDTADGDLPAPDAEPPEVDLEPGMDVDAAHERAVEAFEAAGYHVSPGELMNSVDGPLGDDAKLFNFQDREHIYTGVVYPEEWTDEVVNGVLTLSATVLPESMNDGLYLVSAHEPPSAPQYIAGRHPRGAFTVEAMSEVQNGPPFDASSASEYAEVGRELLANYFDLGVDVDDLDSLERLDEVVLTELRTVESHERSQEGYVPREALLTVGTLAGEVMRRAFERDYGARATWSEGADVSSTGVALTVAAGEDEITVNPVGKTFKLFENGSEDSLAFMYQTSGAVLQGDLE